MVPLRHLDELPAWRKGAAVYAGKYYTYQVRESKVTDDGDMSVILPSDNPEISLITCVGLGPGKPDLLEPPGGDC